MIVEGRKLKSYMEFLYIYIYIYDCVCAYFRLLYHYLLNWNVFIRFDRLDLCISESDSNKHMKTQDWVVGIEFLLSTTLPLPSPPCKIYKTHQTSPRCVCLDWDGNYQLFQSCTKSLVLHCHHITAQLLPFLFFLSPNRHVLSMLKLLRSYWKYGSLIILSVVMVPVSITAGSWWQAASPSLSLSLSIDCVIGSRSSPSPPLPLPPSPQSSRYNIFIMMRKNV